MRGMGWEIRKRKDGGAEWLARGWRDIRFVVIQKRNGEYGQRFKKIQLFPVGDQAQQIIEALTNLD